MKIVLYRNKCIGCGSCAAVCPKYFEMAEDGFSHIKESQRDSEGNDFSEIKEDDKKCAAEAADVCPVQIIKIT
ncbi:MAG: ferredoxin [Candidatus Portnoybacteria bacterium]|nr:ferredoxin [Candidatus Portnoybacteria bacterium]